ncbi:MULTISPECIES: ATP-binding protein [unclassified Oceanispirochaeta]|uniref:ATP-binding protein n=1 Tax=unclassified Oceanispirochaeta TaxID=2635722 RepID=UPI000E09232A|nr:MULTISPECIES: ATP-binding protein [unclassified Oceanispirochaeta]MBF9018309.1 ATP-binding protein [Oceanispirochaeta sp. M2]NPD74774.1 ATP-binding protein [Oceanispirochaeta sp. M1]RDG29386.1 ATP-binding protein [Oceanispirochaeta sp. M1]
MDRIEINDNHKLMNTEGMFYKEFPSDFRQIRYFTLLIVQKAPPEIREINLLEQQISELIKNAVKHGNGSNPDKIVKVWYTFSEEQARIIIEDKGKGFTAIKDWNDFNIKRNDCLNDEDYESLAEYVSFRTEKSDDNDGGNAMFAALEYWNEGVVFTDKANCVAVGKTFPKKNTGIELD